MLFKKESIPQFLRHCIYKIMYSVGAAVCQKNYGRNDRLSINLQNTRGYRVVYAGGS
jgi:hypothetical protein